MTDTTPPPLTADQLQEYREADLGEWYEGPWTQDYVEAKGDDPAHNRVVHHESGTALATLPDFAGPIALWIAVAREAHPKMLAEIDRLRARNSELESVAGADGLEPSGHTLQLGARDGADGEDEPQIRMHFAFAPDLPDADRDRFVMELSKVIARNL